MGTFGQPQFNQPQPAGPGPYPVDFLDQLIRCLPANYVDRGPGGNLDFLQRLLTPNAEDLTQWHSVFDRLYTYLDPFACPLDWLQWITTEWFGWTLIPDNYPEARQRKLLAHLAADMDGSGIGFHYQNRGTVTGVRNLLLEFGVHAIVTDQPPYAGAYLGSDFPGSVYPAMQGSDWPLGVRVVVQYYEPAEQDVNLFSGGYLGALGASPGNVYLKQPAALVNDEFVVKLVEWERAAGVKAVIEWRTSAYQSADRTTVLG